MLAVVTLALLSLGLKFISAELKLWEYSYHAHTIMPCTYNNGLADIYLFH